MPSNKFVSVSNGLRIAFGKSGFVADILTVSHSGVARALIETSHMGTPEPGDGEIGGKTFIVDPLEDPGQLQLQVHYDPSNPPKRTDPDDPELLGDLVLAAANEAIRSAQQAVEAKLRAQMPDLGGLGLPGL